MLDSSQSQAASRAAAQIWHLSRPTPCLRRPAPPKLTPHRCAARIADLVKRGTLDLSAVRFFVLDEADRLVDQDGLATVQQLFQALPKSGTGTARLQVSHLLDLCLLRAEGWLGDPDRARVKVLSSHAGRCRAAGHLQAPPAHRRVSACPGGPAPRALRAVVKGMPICLSRQGAAARLLPGLVFNADGARSAVCCPPGQRACGGRAARRRFAGPCRWRVHCDCRRVRTWLVCNQQERVHAANGQGCCCWCAHGRRGLCCQASTCSRLTRQPADIRLYSSSACGQQQRPVGRPQAGLQHLTSLMPAHFLVSLVARQLGFACKHVLAYWGGPYSRTPQLASTRQVRAPGQSSIPQPRSYVRRCSSSLPRCTRTR